MANTYHQIYLQIIFAVKYRRAVIDKSWQSTLFGVIGNLINENKCKTLIVNGVEDHVHCFLGLKPVISVSDLMKDVKARSSKFINDHSLTPWHFEWQEGFSVLSYSQKDVHTIYKYIQHQQQHHQVQTFLEEYRQLLEEFKIDYDERFIFKALI